MPANHPGPTPSNAPPGAPPLVSGCAPCGWWPAVDPTAVRTRRDAAHATYTAALSRLTAVWGWGGPVAPAVGAVAYARALAGWWDAVTTAMDTDHLSAGEAVRVVRARTARHLAAVTGDGSPDPFTVAFTWSDTAATRAFHHTATAVLTTAHTAVHGPVPATIPGDPAGCPVATLTAPYGPTGT